MADKVQILLVEDNPADVELTRENLNSCKILHDLHVVYDGMEAMAFLRREEEYAGKPRPDLVLLDLNLPRKDGREVLSEIKEDVSLRRIPVVVLTSSSAESDIVKSYDLYANAYVVKPVDLEGIGEIVRSIEEFWFSVVKFPPNDS